MTKQHSLKKRHKNEHKWFYGCSSLHPRDKPLLQSFASAFRKAYAMDFYITKYQGKMMESLTPLFQTMTSGIHRLEAQEAQEAEELKKVKFQNSEGDDAQPRKKLKTREDLARRARRVCIRLASMANRCYWLSATEVAIHVLTGGDCLQSHNNVRLFTRQLQWAMQECKRQLNNEMPAVDASRGQHSVQAVTVQMRMAGTDTDGVMQPGVIKEDSDPEIVIEDVQACTSSTNTADDYAHRGIKLQCMPFMSIGCMCAASVNQGERIIESNALPFHIALRFV